MKKINLLITLTFAAMLVVPAVYGQSDNVELHDIVEWQAGWARDCPEVRDRDGDDPHIVWKCNAEAIIAWCFKNIVMSHDANEQQKQNARYKECGNREGYKELLHNHPGYGAVSTVHKPGDKVRFHLPQNAKRATVYYSYCPYFQYVPIMNVDSGTFYCDPIFEFETSLDSSASAGGNKDSADADDLYERLFGELESRLSVLLGDSGSSDEVVGNLLELLGSELSFDDALGNIGKGQTASGDQGSKQNNLSAACEEFLATIELRYRLIAEFNVCSDACGVGSGSVLCVSNCFDIYPYHETQFRLQNVADRVDGIDGRRADDIDYFLKQDFFHDYYDNPEAMVSEFLKQAGVCGY